MSGQIAWQRFHAILLCFPASRLTNNKEKQ
jgi:hypothetical protein